MRISIQNLIKTRTKYTFNSNSFLFLCFFCSLECRKCARWDFTAPTICAVAHFRGSTGCKKCALLAAMLLFHSWCFTHSINQASNTRLACSMWPARAFCAARNARWELPNNQHLVYSPVFNSAQPASEQVSVKV